MVADNPLKKEYHAYIRKWYDDHIYQTSEKVSTLDINDRITADEEVDRRSYLKLLAFAEPSVRRILRACSDAGFNSLRVLYHYDREVDSLKDQLRELRERPTLKFAKESEGLGAVQVDGIIVGYFDMEPFGEVEMVPGGSRIMELIFYPYEHPAADSVQAANHYYMKILPQSVGPIDLRAATVDVMRIHPVNRPVRLLLQIEAGPEFLSDSIVHLQVAIGLQKVDLNGIEFDVDPIVFPVKAVPPAIEPFWESRLFIAIVSDLLPAIRSNLNV